MLSTPRLKTSIFEIDDVSGWRNRVERWKSELRFGYPFYASKFSTIALPPTGIDIILVEHLELLSKVANTLALPRIPGVPIAVMSHGAQSMDFFWDDLAEMTFRDLPKRHLRNTMIGGLLSHESELYGSVDAVWTLNDTERRLAEWLGAKKTYLLPNFFQVQPIVRNPRAGWFGFVGTLTHPINRAGLSSLIREVEKADNPNEIRIRLVGREPRSWHSSRPPFVDMLGPLEDQALYKEMESWQAMLHPLFCWAKGRSMKVSSAIELGLPLISSAQGTRGYELEANEHYLRAETPAAMVADMMKAVRNGDQLELIREKMIERTESTLTLRAAQDILADQLQELVNEDK